MKKHEYPDIGKINAALDAARKKLRYIYFHNFVGSDWVNTLCPDCGMEVVERLSLGCGGDKLNEFHCIDNCCPQCGRKIRMHGHFSAFMGNSKNSKIKACDHDETGYSLERMAAV